MGKNMYEAFISCYNDAHARFDFFAESSALAKDHIGHIISDRNMLKIFEWDKFPGQVHYIRYKKDTNQKYIYVYTKEMYTGEQNTEPSFSDLFKRYNEYDALKEENKKLKAMYSLTLFN